MEAYSGSISQLFGQLSFVSAVLAGFSVTLYVELLPHASKKRLGKISTSFALLAAALFIVATISSVFATVRVTDHIGTIEEALRSRLSSTFRWSVLMLFSGLIAFLVSLGSCGWTHSRTLGIISTIISVLAFILTFYILFGVLGFS